MCVNPGVDAGLSAPGLQGHFYYALVFSGFPFRKV